MGVASDSASYGQRRIGVYVSNLLRAPSTPIMASLRVLLGMSKPDHQRSPSFDFSSEDTPQKVGHRRRRAISSKDTSILPDTPLSHKDPAKLNGVRIGYIGGSVPKADDAENEVCVKAIYKGDGNYLTYYLYNKSDKIAESLTTVGCAGVRAAKVSMVFLLVERRER